MYQIHYAVIHSLWWVEFMYKCTCLSSLPALENTDSDIGVCGWLLVVLSVLLMLATLPISIWMCIKVSCWLNSVFIPLFTSPASMEWGWQGMASCARVGLKNLLLYCSRVPQMVTFFYWLIHHLVCKMLIRHSFPTYIFKCLLLDRMTHFTIIRDKTQTDNSKYLFVMVYFRPLKGCFLRILPMDHPLSGPYTYSSTVWCVFIRRSSAGEPLFCIHVMKKASFVEERAVLFKYLYTGVCPSVQLHQSKDKQEEEKIHRRASDVVSPLCTDRQRVWASHYLPPGAHFARRSQRARSELSYTAIYF